MRDRCFIAVPHLCLEALGKKYTNLGWINLYAVKSTRIFLQIFTVGLEYCGKSGIRTDNMLVVILLMKAWSPDWFEELYLSNYDRLRDCAYRSLEDGMIADELVQETFLILWNRKQELKKKRHPNIEGWLVITLRNLVKNELKRAKHRNECPLFDESVVVTMEQYESLEDLMPRSLTPDERQVMLWHYEEQFDTKEIARRMQVSENTVRVRLFRARQKYKKFSENKKIYVTKTACEYIER